MRHPDYDSFTQNGNDIALIFLQSDLPEDRQIPNVALNCNPNVPVNGQKLDVFGWGLISNEPDLRDAIEIQTATVSALTNADCNNVSPTILDDMLCVQQEGIEVGKGDSGTCNYSA